MRGNVHVRFGGREWGDGAGDNPTTAPPPDPTHPVRQPRRRHPVQHHQPLARRPLDDHQYEPRIQAMGHRLPRPASLEPKQLVVHRRSQPRRRETCSRTRAPCSSRRPSARGSRGSSPSPHSFSASLGARSNGEILAHATFLPIRYPASTVTRSSPRSRCRPTHPSIRDGTTLPLTECGPTTQAPMRARSRRPTPVHLGGGTVVGSGTAPSSVSSPGRFYTWCLPMNARGL